MKIAKLGKHTYAFGLTWCDSDQSPQMALSASLQTETPSAWFVALRAESGRWHVGWWFCIVTGGVVINQTDQLIDEENASSLIEEMRETTGLTVYCYGSLVDDARPFDPVAAIAKAKPKYLNLKKASTGTGPLQMVAIVLMIVAAGGGMWFAWEKTMGKPPVKKGKTPEEIRRDYIRTVRNGIGKVPAQADWAVNALMASRNEFPAYRAGWALARVTCQSRNGCSATYMPQREAIGYSADELGGAIAADGRSATRSLPLQIQTMDPTDAEILNFPAIGLPVGELAGTFGLRFPEVEVERRINVTQLDARIRERPPGAKPIYTETIKLQSKEPIEPFVMSSTVAFWGEQGFRVTTFMFSNGNGGPNGWTAELTRVRGDYR
jgi:hypothetical protein